MNITPNRGGSRRPEDLARSIAWPDYDANLKLAQKTRRAVRDEVISSEERRAHRFPVPAVAAGARDLERSGRYPGRGTYSGFACAGRSAHTDALFNHAGCLNRVLEGKAGCGA